MKQRPWLTTTSKSLRRGRRKKGEKNGKTEREMAIGGWRRQEGATRGRGKTGACGGEMEDFSIIQPAPSHWHRF